MARKPHRTSYRDECLAAIRPLFPPQWFSRFSTHGNGDWTAQKVFWMSIVMSWQPQTTLTEQFHAARDVLRRVQPRWRLGRSCAAFLTARQRLWEEMQGPLRQRHLVTNLQDERQLSLTTAAELYRLRWGIELYYRTFKQTLGHRTLQSRTPHMALVEQGWHIVATWLLHLLTARELVAAGKSPESWSAAQARDAVRRLFRRALANQRCPPRETLRCRLRQATRDEDTRRGPKQIRDWPRKKREQPPGPPQLRVATPQERQQAQRVRDSISPS